MKAFRDIYWRRLGKLCNFTVVESKANDINNQKIDFKHNIVIISEINDENAKDVENLLISNMDDDRIHQECWHHDKQRDKIICAPKSVIVVQRLLYLVLLLLIALIITIQRSRSRKKALFYSENKLRKYRLQYNQLVRDREDAERSFNTLFKNFIKNPVMYYDDVCRGLILNNPSNCDEYLKMLIDKLLARTSNHHMYINITCTLIEYGKFNGSDILSLLQLLDDEKINKSLVIYYQNNLTTTTNTSFAGGGCVFSI